MRTLKKLHPQVYLVTTDNQEELGKIFCRMQEFYESPNPKYKRQAFELNEFLDWYKGTYDKDYFKEWEGFNIPGGVYKEFLVKYTLCKIGFSEGETWLAKELTKTDIGTTPFYLIGCLEGDLGTLKHEVSHALFYLNPDYKKQVTQLFSYCTKLFPRLFLPLEAHLVELGYCNEVLVDEFAAYVLADKDYLIEKKIWVNGFDKLQENIDFEFNFYLPYLGETNGDQLQSNQRNEASDSGVAEQS